MVRSFKKKTNRGNTPPDIMLAAAKRINENAESYRSVAAEFGIHYKTLYRYCVKIKKARESGNLSNIPEYTGYAKVKQVFTIADETILAEYFKHASRVYYGLTPHEIRDLAYDYAIQNGKTFPHSWHEKKRAGSDWFSAFMKRNSDLSIRTPEATSLGRATSFNQVNVANFFENLNNVMEKHNFGPQDIYNTDETGVTTVQRPSKIVAQKGVKQIGKLTSAERGTLVTVACTVNAVGQALPPMFIFPRVFFKDHFIRDGPAGCIGDAQPSGWMTRKSFLQLMHHIVKHSRCSQERPILLILDNHDSHIAIDTIEFAKENGVVILSFPPHCSHKLQPLDRSVYAPFKRHINVGSDAWMKNNPGKTMTIYDIPSIVNTAFNSAMTPNNIMAGFKVSGIYPFNKEIFDESEFLPAQVTDRPLTQIISEQKESEQTERHRSDGQPSLSNNAELISKQTSVTPESIRPIPKAGPRQGKATKRYKATTQVLTDTPVKNALREREEAKKLKQAAKDRNQGPSKKIKKILHFKETRTQLRNVESSDSDQSELDEEVVEEDFLMDKELAPGNYILVRFEDGKVGQNYVGRIISIKDDNLIETTFMRKCIASTRFHGPTLFFFPDEEDVATHEATDILLNLPVPSVVASTSRRSQRYAFGCDFSEYKPQ